MTEKTKRIVLIAVCCALCVAVGMGIVTRFGGRQEGSGTSQNSGDSTADINFNKERVSVPVRMPDPAGLVQGADSSGTEQSIQGAPIKPGVPGKPKIPARMTALPDDHSAQDVPAKDRKTEDEPAPTYSEQPTSKTTESEPAAGSTNSSGQVYVPGFGYVDSSGENDGGTLEDMYENGNKIGEMGGGN